MRLRSIIALTVVMAAWSFNAASALACRVSPSPFPASISSSLFAPDMVGVEATLLRAYESEQGEHSNPANDDIDWVYLIEVRSVLRNDIRDPIKPGDQIFVQNPASLCGEFRPIKASNFQTLKSTPTRDFFLVLRRASSGSVGGFGGEGTWFLRGGNTIPPSELSGAVR